MRLGESASMYVRHEEEEAAPGVNPTPTECDDIIVSISASCLMPLS